MSQLIIPKPAGSVTSVNGSSGVVSLSTNNIPENGSLYFTNARAASALSANNTAGNSFRGTSYDRSTGVLTISADYLTATPYTFVLRDANGNIIANTGNFTELNVSDVLNVSNQINVTNLNVTGVFTSPLNVSGTLSAFDYTVNQQYIAQNFQYISAVISLSSQAITSICAGGIVIDPAGGTNYTIKMPVFAIGGINVDVSGYEVSGAQLQVSAWVPLSASFMFTLIGSSSATNLISIIPGSCQTVYFSQN